MSPFHFNIWRELSEVFNVDGSVAFVVVLLKVGALVVLAYEFGLALINHVRWWMLADSVRRSGAHLRRDIVLGADHGD